MRRFAGIRLLYPDEILNFRHLLEQHILARSWRLARLASGFGKAASLCDDYRNAQLDEEQR